MDWTLTKGFVPAFLMWVRVCFHRSQLTRSLCFLWISALQVIHRKSRCQHIPSSQHCDKNQSHFSFKLIWKTALQGKSGWDKMKQRNLLSARSLPSWLQPSCPSQTKASSQANAGFSQRWQGLKNCPGHFIRQLDQKWCGTELGSAPIRDASIPNSGVTYCPTTLGPAPVSSP